MCFTCIDFELDRLRRSSSSPPNPLVGFQHLACMLACTSVTAASIAHVLRPIVVFLHFQLVLQVVLKLWFQSSPFQSSSLHTAILQTTSVPIPVIFRHLLAACSSSSKPACSPLFRLLLTALRNQIVAGASHDARTGSLHSQLAVWSLFVVTFGVVRHLLAASEFPHESIDAQQHEHGIKQGGGTQTVMKSNTEHAYRHTAARRLLTHRNWREQSVTTRMFQMM